MSHVQRTLKELRKKGMPCAVVEKWNHHTKCRQDLFGIIDVIALDHTTGVLGIQVCGADFRSHIRKITIEKAEETRDWLLTPGSRLEVWGWRKLKLKRGGKALRWKCRVQEITLSDIVITKECDND